MNKRIEFVRRKSIISCIINECIIPTDFAEKNVCMALDYRSELLSFSERILLENKIKKYSKLINKELEIADEIQNSF
jgi:hypothetical protein